MGADAADGDGEGASAWQEEAELGDYGLCVVVLGFFAGVVAGAG